VPSTRRRTSSSSPSLREVGGRGDEEDGNDATAGEKVDMGWRWRWCRVVMTVAAEVMGAALVDSSISGQKRIKRCTKEVSRASEEDEEDNDNDDDDDDDVEGVQACVDKSTCKWWLQRKTLSAARRGKSLGSQEKTGAAKRMMALL
jgi:hypothetical protein